MTSNTATPIPDFHTAWRDTFTRHRDLIALLDAVIAATHAGAHPVPLTDIATRLRRTPEQTRQLFTDVAPAAAAWANTRLDNDIVQLDLATAATTPRFRYHIGDRSIGVDGCAPDIFLVAFALRQPFHTESRCPVTGTAIRLDFDAHSVTAVDPPTAVVAAIHPQTAPQAFLLIDPDRIDADICLHQPFFTDTTAAAGWLAAHPGGKVMPPADFYRQFDQLVSHALGSRHTWATKDRVARLSPAARQLHQQILHGFARSGAAPQGGSQQLLKELHDTDVIRLDTDGTIRAAYPFSATPTAHRVAIHGGPRVYAMCAIDALGIAAMLDRDVTITSADPATGSPITVTLTRGAGAAFEPDTTVALVGSDTTPAGSSGDDCSPTAERCCGVMNFFSGTGSARTWLAAHPHVSGVVLTGDQALRVGTDVFGDLLRNA